MRLINWDYYMVEKVLQMIVSKDLELQRLGWKLAEKLTLNEVENLQHRYIYSDHIVVSMGNKLQKLRACIESLNTLRAMTSK